MTIDLNKLKQQGLTEAEFSFDYLPQEELVSLPSARIDGAVKVKVSVTLKGKDATVCGKVNYLLKGECSRCLEPAQTEVESDFYAEYGLDNDAEYPIKGGQIDVEPPVKEAIIVGAPMVIYCKSDCKGLCPTCGANLNYNKCKCNT